MNRRDFTKALGATGLATALPASLAAKAAPADFWTRYLTALHGSATPSHVAVFQRGNLARVAIAARSGMGIAPRKALAALLKGTEDRDGPPAA